MLNKHLRYLKKVVRHKWYVFVECLRLGIPIRGLLHDMSKFNPVEWFPYVAKNEFGFGKRAPDDIQLPFEAAFNHHQKANDHHWQYWVYFLDYPDARGTYLCLPMSDKARRELLADWRGAAKIYGDGTALDYYKKNAHNMQLHPETRAWIEVNLDYWPAHGGELPGDENRKHLRTRQWF